MAYPGFVDTYLLCYHANIYMNYVPSSDVCDVGSRSPNVMFC